MKEYPRTAYAYYVTFILLFAYSVSFIDRQILSLLVDPIKADLNINDTQMSLLHGFAFAIFYSTLGILLGRVADRSNRRNVIIVGVLVWSLATASGGLAIGFFTLFLARIFVGAGEAGLSPSAYSLICDYFPQTKRARALSIYSLGVYVGSALAFIVGGMVVALVKGTTSWQSVLFLVSAPGFVVALLMFTVKEPPRQTEVIQSTDFRYFKIHKNIYFPMILGYSTISVVTLGLMAWVPALFIRTWGWTPRDVGLTYGTILLVCGLPGMMLSGLIADFLVAKGRADGAFIASIAGSALLIPATFALHFANTEYATWVALAFITFFLGFPIALAPAVYQTVTPNVLRGQVISIYLLANTLIGMSAGPTAVAAISNYVLHDETKVKLSLSIVCLTASILGVVFLFLSTGPYRKLMKKLAAAHQS